MNPIYIPLLSALAGTLIGSLTSIAVIVVQARMNDRRERIRQAARMAMEEYRVAVANLGPGRAVLPFTAFLHHHIAIQKALEDDDFTPERIALIASDDEAVTKVVIEIDKRIRGHHQ